MRLSTFSSFQMSTQALYLSYIVFPLNCYFLRFMSCFERPKFVCVKMSVVQPK